METSPLLRVVRGDVRNINTVKELRRICAEFLGTFIFTFVACYTIIFFDHASFHKHHHSDHFVTLERRESYLLPKLANGFIIIALTFALAAVSGAHFNPAITFGFFIRGMMKWWRLFTYWFAQFLGGILAAVVVYAYFEHNQMGAPVPVVNNGKTFFLEMLFTFILVFIVLNASTRSKILGTNAALAIGSTIIALDLIGWHTGPSLNPAFSFGPALLAKGAALRKVWIYLLAPMVGSLLAALLTYFFVPKISTRRRGEIAEGYGSSPAVIDSSA